MALESDFAKEFEHFRKRCVELEEKSKKDEIRCLRLEIEVERLRRKNQELEGKIVIVDSNCVKNDSYILDELMIENKVLECEKRKAETDLSFWKEKVQELESKINSTNEKVKEDDNVVLKETKEVFHRQVRKLLSFEEGGFPNKKMAPSTPGVAQSPFHCVIDISDEDVNNNEIPTLKKVSGSRKCGDLTKSQHSPKNNLQKTNLERMDEDSSNTRNTKRKRAAKIITSDVENNYDDNAPICTLKTQHTSRVSTDSDEEVKENVSRRYLTRLRKSESKNKQSKSSFDKSISLGEDDEDNDSVDESESEGESLGGFIVDSSESAPICDSESSDSTNEFEDGLNEYKVTLAKIGRKKNMNLNWELEGDMLSDFGKDPELCMSAAWLFIGNKHLTSKNLKKHDTKTSEGLASLMHSRVVSWLNFSWVEIVRKRWKNWKDTTRRELNDAGNSQLNAQNSYLVFTRTKKTLISHRKNKFMPRYVNQNMVSLVVLFC